MNNVDILIPVHGIPIYLKQTLQSVVSQKFINKIYLVLDRVDMSYFSRLDIAKQSENIEIVVSKKPGIVEALNLGLSISKAKYIARIDSDDLMIDNRIEIQRNFMENNLNCVCVGSNLEVFGENIGKYVKKYPTAFKSIMRRMEYQNSIAHPSVMYLADKVRQVGGYRNLFEGSEDYDLWFRLSKVGEIRNINAPLTKYRKSPEQYSMKFSKYRVTLDSLVRIANFDSEVKKNIVNYYQQSSSTKVEEIYSYQLNYIGGNDRPLLRKIKKYEAFSILLVEFSVREKLSIWRSLRIIAFFVIHYPFFSGKVLLNRILI